MHRTHCLVIFMTCLLSSCVYYPKVAIQPYHRGCELVIKQLEIDVYTKLGDSIVHGMHSCDDEACLAVLALAVSIPVTTFVVSGSIILANNTLYWLEAQVKCEDEVYEYSLS